MMTISLQEVMPIAEALSYADKLALADRLLKLAQQEALARRNSSEVQQFTANGQPIANGEFDVLRRREYQWLKEHRAEYAGQYVALVGSTLIAHGLSLKEVIAEAQASGAIHPFFSRIETPEEERHM